MTATTLGSYFMSFGAVAGTAYYPTDGQGGFGSGSLSSASHLKDVSHWILTGFTVSLIGSTSTRTWTLKDSSGSTITSWQIPISMPIGQNIEVGFNMRIDDGFTIETDHADCQGYLSYQIVRYKQS